MSIRFPGCVRRACAVESEIFLAVVIGNLLLGLPQKSGVIRQVIDFLGKFTKWQAGGLLPILGLGITGPRCVHLGEHAVQGGNLGDYLFVFRALKL